MERTTFKSMALPWARKWPLLLQTFFMAITETQILSESVAKPTAWKRYIDDIFSLWDISKPDVETFIERANSHHPTIKFTADISETETTFLDSYSCVQRQAIPTRINPS